MKIRHTQFDRPKRGPARRDQWHSLLGCQPSGITVKMFRTCAASLLLLSFIAAFALLTPGSPAQPQQKSSANNPSRSLHKLGQVVAKAVLDKDIESLLKYDREDLRPQNELSLKNNKSDLYCYIFDSECITWGSGNWRSVYEKLSQAHPLEIKVTLTHSRYDRQLYGNLFFYDSSAVSTKDLSSRDFLCKEAPASVATWKFRLENGKWKAVTPLFDSETRGPCPSETQGDTQ